MEWWDGEGVCSLGYLSEHIQGMPPQPEKGLRHQRATCLPPTKTEGAKMETACCPRFQLLCLLMFPHDKIFADMCPCPCAG